MILRSTEKFRSLLEKSAFIRRIGSETVIYQGINWRGRRADITHDRYGRFVDSIVLFGGKYITLNVVVDDLSDTSDRIAAVFTEAFCHPYREKLMQSALTDEEQALLLDFPKLKFDFHRRGLYHPPSEDRSKTGKSVRLKTALERADAAEHYKIHTGKGDGTFLERRNERNHVMSVFLGCSRTGEIGVDGETLLQSATCNAMYEGVNFTRMLFQMHSHLPPSVLSTNLSHTPSTALTGCTMNSRNTISQTSKPRRGSTDSIPAIIELYQWKGALYEKTFQ